MYFYTRRAEAVGVDVKTWVHLELETGGEAFIC